MLVPRFHQRRRFFDRLFKVQGELHASIFRERIPRFTIIMSSVIESVNPSSDLYTELIDVEDADLEDHGDTTTSENALYIKTAQAKNKAIVPMFDQLNPVSPWSPLLNVSIFSDTSTAPTSPTTTSIDSLVQWNNADLGILGWLYL